MGDLFETRYPSMGRIAAIYPAPEHILGNAIYWTVKEDGSNVGLYLGENDELMIRSRNMLVAEAKFMSTLKSIDDGALADNLRQLLIDMRDGDGVEAVIFGELCFKGPSPTRIETHDEHKFYMFDIYIDRTRSNDEPYFVPYNYMHQVAYHYDVPVVELLGVTTHTSLDTLFYYKNEFLDQMKERGKEGVVGKVYRKTAIGQIFFKEKNDLPCLDKITTFKEGGDIKVDVLSESETLSEIVKAFDDTPETDWGNPRVMMPLIVRYVSGEAVRRYRRPPKNMHALYQQELERRTTNGE